MIGEYDGSNAVQRRYVHGPGLDNPIMWYEGSGTSDRRFLMADERGSVVSITDSSGATLHINAYDEYGIPAPGNLGRFGYTGQAWLPELGMWYYKARIYSPTLGRFLQTDPIGYDDGMNWYAYVGSDPVNFVDPTGLRSVCVQVGDYPNDCRYDGAPWNPDYYFYYLGRYRNEHQGEGRGGATATPPKPREPEKKDPKKKQTPLCKRLSDKAAAAKKRLTARVTRPGAWNNIAHLRFFQLGYQDNARDAMVAGKLVSWASVPLALLPQSKVAGVATAGGGVGLGELLSAQREMYEDFAEDIQSRIDELKAKADGSCSQ